jgi:DNA-binding MarR family transcriptional regulator
MNDALPNDTNDANDANEASPQEFVDPLDPLLHQPLRTQLAAYLVGRGEATFSELKRVLQCTDGNLDAHLKKLLAADYVEQERRGGGTRVQTCYCLTATGRAAFAAYLVHLQKLLNLTQAVAPDHGAGLLLQPRLA